MELSSKLMIGDDNIKEFMMNNTDFIETKLSGEKVKEVKVLPFVYFLIKVV